ncbi:MAG: D-alanyl-D-alanine carboxypeptidase [Clostridia bacterium]|nr:D-alanyl-D-alanine carboxypeptidase [Clostridia bacterium]
MKRFLSLLLCLVITLSSFFCIPSGAAYDDSMAELKLHSDCLLLMSADNGEIIFEKNIRKQTAPASLTKIVTALVVIENVKNLSSLATVSEECIRELDGTGSSMGNLKAGEQITVYDLLCYLLILSANDAATVLANFVTGTNRQAFIDKMNELVTRLGCTNSHFVNPHGLDHEDQYTTAEDMAKIIKYAMSFKAFAEITGSLTHTVPETNLRDARRLTSTCHLLNKNYEDYYCKYVKGAKTGTTKNAGHCLVTYASKDGYNYIAIALKSIMKDFDNDGYDENGAFLDCKEMLEWAFDNIELVAICDPDKIAGEVKINYAKSTDYVSLVPAETVYSLVPVGTNKGSVLVEPVPESVPESVDAPVKKGDFICKGRVLYAGQVLREIDLVASTDVKRNFFALIGSKAKALVTNPIFIIISIIIIAAVIILLFIRRKKRRSHAVLGRDYKVLSYNDFIHKR